MSRAQRIVGWLLVVVLISMLPVHERGGSIASRLLGPIGSLAAGWQWVRVRLAIEAGKPGLGYSRAELAFELDPDATGAWSFLASHYAHDRASPDAEPDPAMRTSWVRAASSLLERGEATAREPAELAVHRGLIMIHVSDMGGSIPWPGGARGALEEADGAFERAIELDAGNTQAWVQLARNRALRLNSTALESDPQARMQALESALELLHRGSAHARRPEQLVFERGLLLGITADGEDAPRYPGGRVALYEQAIEAFVEAEAAGARMAHEAEQSARLALEALEL